MVIMATMFIHDDYIASNLFIPVTNADQKTKLFFRMKNRECRSLVRHKINKCGTISKKPRTTLNGQYRCKSKEGM